jgi:hypothetical protein
MAADLRQVKPAEPKKRNGWAALVAGLLALAALVGFLLLGRSSTRPIKVESVAVLPLSNLSSDPEQEYFAEGMTDELITNLAKVRSLRVISRTSAMRVEHACDSLRDDPRYADLIRCIGFPP